MRCKGIVYVRVCSELWGGYVGRGTLPGLVSERVNDLNLGRGWIKVGCFGQGDWRELRGAQVYSEFCLG